MVVRCHVRCAIWLPLLVILAISSPVGAQPFEVRGVTYNLSKTMGTISGVGPGWISLKSTVQPLQIVVSDSKLAELKKSTAKAGDPPITTQVAITGKADPSFLVKDLCVTFTAELTGGKGTAPVTEMTLFTPKSPQDLSMIAGEGGAFGAAGLPNGTFLISGQIASFGKGQMLVAAPSDKGRKVKLTVDVSDAVKIAVNIADLSVVQVGDTVEASGYIGTTKEGKPQNIMLAESLKIVLAKPLMSKFKRRELLAANTAKGEPASAPAKAKPAAEADPPKPAEEKPAAGLRDPSMPDKPEAAADGESSEDKAKSVENADEQEQESAVEEELIVLDTFVVDENHTPEK